MNITVKDLLNVKHKAVYNIEETRNEKFSGVSTDSRLIKSGEVFFAIRGDKFDGHEFVLDAFAHGAICVVVDDQSNWDRWQDRPLLVVKDTTKALGDLANIYRKKFSIPFIAVAGSNGKTTTKEMISAILKTKYTVLSTKGNLNNQIGVPMTLFRLMRNHDMAVIEIGTNHFGELRYLCKILQPTHGIITNIGKEHLEFFKSIKGVAKAEGEMFKALNKKGIGFVNLDDRLIVEQSKSLKNKITYSFSKSNVSVKGEYASIKENGCALFSVRKRNRKEFHVQLSVPGVHAMMNGLAAATVGLTFEVPSKNIQYALKSFTGVGKRMEALKSGSIIILNDTYNANPDSMISALETLKSMQCKGNKIIILADMLELGAASEKEHRQIGKIVGEMGFNYLLTFGEMARSINETANVKVKIHYDQKNILSEYAAELLSDGDIVLVKGSRGMKMEDVVTFLIERRRKKVA